MVVSTEIITINYNALALFRVYVHSTRHRDRPMTTADGFVMHISIEFHRRLTSLVIIRFIGMLGSLPADVAICSPATTQKTINKQTLTNDWLWFGRAHSHVLGCTWCAQVLGVEGPMQRSLSVWTDFIILSYFPIYSLGRFGLLLLLQLIHSRFRPRRWFLLLPTQHTHTEVETFAEYVRRILCTYSYK